MNIIATTLLAGAFTALPGLQMGQMDIIPSNPLEGLTVSVGGLGVEIDGQGVRAEPTKIRDFQIELRLKSGTPIQVSL